MFKCRGTELDLNKRTHIMGILNLTPDSFYDTAKYTEIDLALSHTEKMVKEGADIIDIGGESTRPGSDSVSLEEELNRVIPTIQEIRKRFDVTLSIDTTKSTVAEEAAKEGVSIINDISGLKFDNRIAEIAAEYEMGIVLMHTTSRPKDMQLKTHYKSLVQDVIDSLRFSVEKVQDIGVADNSIVIDPGFGFGKTPEQNLILLKNLKKLSQLGKPILIGTSNKSFIGQILNRKINERMEGTAATIAIGIMNGASIVRVHNAGQMRQVSRMVDAVLSVN